MLLWVIIKTTDNGAKCLLTGLAVILRNQDRWEHYTLQINLFNNEGPHSVLTRSCLLLREATQHVQFVLHLFLSEFLLMIKADTDFVRNTKTTLHWVIQVISKQAECRTFLSCYSFMTKT